MEVSYTETSLSVSEQNKAKNGFMDAIRSGNESLAMHFVTEYPNIDLISSTVFEAEENKQNPKKSINNGDHCLIVAVRNLSYNLIIYLLTNGVSPNLQNQINGETALHTAVRARDVRVVAMLSKYGADANITNAEYETPLVLASENNDQDIIELLASDTQNEIRDRCMSNADASESDMSDFADDILSDGNATKTKTLPQFEFGTATTEEMETDDY